MKKIVKLLVVLTGVCVVAGLILSFVNEATTDARAYQDRLEMLNALNMVLPEHDNEPDKDIIEISGVSYYVSRLKGSINSIAFITLTEKGYGGRIKIIVGVKPYGEIIGIGILQQKETPGLGSKIADAWFGDQYKGKTLANAKWLVKKDGGDFDQISGATISPRAVTSAVKDGLEKFAVNKTEILGGTDVSQ